MMQWFMQPVWSPYVTGAGIGILATLTLLISRKPLSCSTAFAKSAGMIERIFRGTSVAGREFFKTHGLGIDWQWMLIIGICIGSFVSAALSGSLHVHVVSEWWRSHIGADPMLRMITGFAGGILMGFGARLADGCTSGHGISGMIFLSVGSIVAVICFFAGGIGMALLIVHLSGGGF